MHDQLASFFAGSEKVLFNIYDVVPQADLYTTVLDKDILPEKYRHLGITSTFIQNLPFAKSKYKAYFPIMPVAVEHLDLQEYDLIFSSHHCVAKGVIPRPDAVHFCYCHSPARYIWDLFWTYSPNKGLKQILTSFVAQYLRMWDVTSSARVDRFLANSSFTAERIKKYYGRDSEILYPPVDTNKFNYESTQDYYLMAGRLASYKGYDLAVEAFNKSGKKLVVAGDGTEYQKLKEMAKPNVELLGLVSDEKLVELMNNCKAFVFPGKEDFGIVMAEAQSAGKPVIAHNVGGAKDIVVNNETGLLFEEKTVDALNKAIEQFENESWDYNHIANHARKFDTKVFQTRIKELVDNYKDFKSENILYNIADNPDRVLEIVNDSSQIVVKY